MENKNDLKNRENQVALENEKIESLIPEGVEAKNSNKLVLILTIIIVILIFIIGFMFFTNLNKEEVSTPDVEEKEEVDQNITITDDLKLDLGNKINKLLYTGKATTAYEESINVGNFSFKYTVLHRELNTYEKQFITLNTIIYDKLEGSRWEEVPSVKSAVDNMKKYSGWELMMDEFGSLTFDKVNKAHNELFGEDFGTPAQSTGKCPTIIYDSNTNEFYKLNAACGGTSAGSVVFFKDKFESTKDTVDVYVNMGHVAPNNNNMYKYLVYSDFEVITDNGSLSTIIKPINVVEEIDGSLAYSYKITSENKDKFSQYKFTFKMKDNNLYFEKVTKIK